MTPPLKFAPAVLAVLALATVAPVSAQAWTPAPDGTRTELSVEGLAAMPVTETAAA